MTHPADHTRPQRVLLIDDGVMIHHLVRVRLAAEDIELHVAGSADAGLALAAAVRPDVILLDVELAGPPDPAAAATAASAAAASDGYDVCRRLQDDPALAAAQVIFLSTHATVAERTRGLDLGAVDFVAKPFDPAELRARVRAGLRTKRLLDLLATKAQHDGLTGLWNRAYLNDRLAAEVARADRYGLPLSLVLADVDRFKSINDRFGHPFGDDVLRHVAATLRSVSRTEDVVCRYGGEEFAVVAVGTDPAGGAVLAERLRLAVRGLTLAVGPDPVLVTASFGVAAVAGADTSTPALLLAEADRCLYDAKRTGRDRVVCRQTATAAAAA